MPARPSSTDAPPTVSVALMRFDDLLMLGLRSVLASDPSLSVVAQDITYARVPATLRAHRPSVLILASEALPDLAAVRVLRDEHSATRLVLLGDAVSTTESAQLLAFGASACLARDTQARDVLNAIHLASRGLQLMPIGASDGGAPVLDPLLTPREGDVLVLLRAGRSNAQIALELHIGVETVRTHARSIYRKLGVVSRRELNGRQAAPRPAPPAAAPPARARRRSERPAPRRPLHS